MQPAVAIRAVTKRYPFFALENIDFDLQPGEAMGLVGPNGAGKSTLLRILVGLVRPDAGAVHVLGRAMPREQREVKEQIGFVADDMSLYGHKTIAWHMELVRSFSPRWDSSYAAALLDRFGLRPDQRAKGLSRGQHVKALLLLALARRPRLLLLDEPTAGLDPIARTGLLQELAAIVREEGHALLFSSHYTLDVEDLCDRVTFLHGGALLFSGRKDELLRRGGAGRTLEEIFLEQVARSARRAA